MATFSLNSILSTLKTAGLSGSTLTTAIQSLAANSPTAAVQAICTAILANSNNPTVIKDEATKLAEIPSLPVAVANLLPMLNAATNPEQIVQAVEAIEAALGPQSGFSLGML